VLARQAKPSHLYCLFPSGTRGPSSEPHQVLPATGLQADLCWPSNSPTTSVDSIMPRQRSDDANDDQLLPVRLTSCHTPCCLWLSLAADCCCQVCSALGEGVGSDRPPVSTGCAVLGCDWFIGLMRVSGVLLCQRLLHCDSIRVNQWYHRSAADSASGHSDGHRVELALPTAQ
jgi:hypothetical protein